MTEAEIEEFLKGLNENNLTVKKVKFPELKKPLPSGMKVSLTHLNNVKVTITAELGSTVLKGQEILDIREGKLIILNKAVGEQVDLYINNQRFAKGEVLVIGDMFAIRISSIYPAPDKVNEKIV
jgi:flagellar motor switch protein FliN/FliY